MYRCILIFCKLLVQTNQSLLRCRKLTPSIVGKKITVIVRNESTAAAQAFSGWLNVSYSYEHNS